MRTVSSTRCTSRGTDVLKSSVLASPSAPSATCSVVLNVSTCQRLACVAMQCDATPTTHLRLRLRCRCQHTRALTPESGDANEVDTREDGHCNACGTAGARSSLTMGASANLVDLSADRSRFCTLASCSKAPCTAQAPQGREKAGTDASAWWRGGGGTRCCTRARDTPACRETLAAAGPPC